ncbi:MAG TPA: hypothetical protein VI072_03800 [Polyangiaceae bacterium]
MAADAALADNDRRQPATPVLARADQDVQSAPRGANARQTGLRGQASKHFSSVVRLHAGYGIASESWLTLGTLALLPARFFIAAAGMLGAQDGEANSVELDRRAFSATLGYGLAQEGWLSSLAGVVRYQVATDMPSNIGGGIQWEISRLPGLSSNKARFPWKTFVQIFCKNDVGAGNVDAYQWLEVHVIKERLQTRFTNALYLIPGAMDGYRGTQDVIVTVWGPVDVFGQHHYQNVPIDTTRSTGSRFSVGGRVSARF